MSIIPSQIKGVIMNDNYLKKPQTLAFIQRIKTHKGSLTMLFKEWAMETGKAQGSVRNLYYALAEKSKTDKEFCAKYFDGTPLLTTKSETFTKQEESLLMKTIGEGKKQGRSVRSIILQMANGDVKKALRFQNKYRNYARQSCPSAKTESVIESKQKEYLIIKKSIDDLIKGIALSIRKENEILKDKIMILQTENMSLRAKMIKNTPNKSALDFFLNDEGSLPN